jgi:hypothetical protein
VFGYLGQRLVAENTPVEIAKPTFFCPFSIHTIGFRDFCSRDFNLRGSYPMFSNEEKPMDAQQHFKNLVTFVAPVLKPYGFSKNRQTFYCRSPNNWGLIDFQKSWQSNKESLPFTVNLGVASDRLLRFFSPDKIKRPSIRDCHWQIRLGYLMNKRDLWWKVDEQTSIENLGKEIVNPLENRAIQEINHYISDESLRDLWISGQSPSLTEFQRLMYLSVFLKELGPLELLEPTLTKLKQISEGKPSAVTAELHIERLRGLQ